MNMNYDREVGPIQATPLYGLWERLGSGWTRLFPSLAYPKRRATVAFQNQLLERALGGRCPERRLIFVGYRVDR